MTDEIRLGGRGAWRALPVVMVLGLCGFAAGAFLLSVSGGSSFHGGASGPSASASRFAGKRLGATDPNARIDFSLALRLPGKQRLEGFLAAVRNPHSPLYRHFIDARTFGLRFGVSNASLDRVSQLLARAGVKITRRYPERTQLDAQAPVGVVDRLFGVRLTDFRDSHGRRYHRPETAVHVPSTLASVVSGLSGLSSQHLNLKAAVPAGGLRPVDTERAYDIGPLHRMGIEGQKQTIAVISLDGPEVPGDLQAYDQANALPPHQTHPINIGPVASGASDENDLDLQVIHSIAPQAQIYDYDMHAASAVLLAPAISQILQTHSADIVSVSYGLCEATNGSRAEMQADDNELSAASAAGVSVFISSGDAGAYTCQRNNPTDTSLSTSYPATSPNVISVGGTSLSVARDGSYLGETPWNVALEQGGGGGGLSTVFPRPGYQTGAGVQNQFSNGMRQVPDVSADADTNTGWSTVCTPCGGPPQSQAEIGGTSASAPFWAASMLLIRQYAAQRGVSRLGFVNPALYAIAADQTPAAAFHDVTGGTNRFYPATPGWDFATGLGSPDVFNLAQDMVAYLRRHPAP